MTCAPCTNFYQFANGGWLNRNPISPEQARLLIATNPHAPAIWRVDAPFANMPEFAEARGCKPGDPMERAAGQQAAIW